MIIIVLMIMRITTSRVCVIIKTFSLTMYIILKTGEKLGISESEICRSDVLTKYINENAEMIDGEYVMNIKICDKHLRLLHQFLTVSLLSKSKNMFDYLPSCISSTATHSLRTLMKDNHKQYADFAEQFKTLEEVAAFIDDVAFLRVHELMTLMGCCTAKLMCGRTITECQEAFKIPKQHESSITSTLAKYESNWTHVLE